MKFHEYEHNGKPLKVALFTRAWIEMAIWVKVGLISGVALFTRAWIEIASASSFSAC